MTSKQFKMQEFKTAKSIVAILFFTSMWVYGQGRKLSEYIEDAPTKAIYAFMESGQDTLIIDAMEDPWVIEPMTFNGIKDKVILFEFGTEIVAQKNAFPKKTDALWKFIDCKNITIKGNHSTLRMNKEEYLEGEWRHVIRLRGCSNIRISDLILRDSGGDGIAIGRSEKKWYSKNIELDGIECINNKRQGISITSAEDVWVRNSCFADTIGTFPGAGVDIEPNVAEERIVNVNFDNCVFKNNFNAGIKLGLPKLTSSSKEVSIVFSNCLLSNNYSIENSKIPAEIFIRSHRTDPVKGTVLFDNCIIEDSGWSMLYSRKNADGFFVTFKDCIAKDICQNPSSGPAIYLEVPHYKYESDFGGYKFENLKIKYSSDKPAMLVRGSRWALYNTLNNVTGAIYLINPLATVKPEITYINYNPSFNSNVELSFEKLKNLN